MTPEELDALEARYGKPSRPCHVLEAARLDGASADVLALVEEVRRLRAENAYLAPRLRAGQRIFAAVDKIDPGFTRTASGTDIDPFHDDTRCEAFLRAWVRAMDARRQPREPDPPCGVCGQGIACQEGCCAEPGADGVLCHRKCAAGAGTPQDGGLSPEEPEEPRWCSWCGGNGNDPTCARSNCPRGCCTHCNGTGKE